MSRGFCNSALYIIENKVNISSLQPIGTINEDTPQLLCKTSSVESGLQLRLLPPRHSRQNTDMQHSRIEALRYSVPSRITARVTKIQRTVA